VLSDGLVGARLMQKMHSAYSANSPDSSQAWCGEPASAGTAEKRCSVACGKPQDLCTTMNTWVPTLGHSAEMGYDNTTESSVAHRRAGLIDNFD